MTPPFQTPVVLKDDLTFEEPGGRVIIPSILYRGEDSHKQHQRDVAMFIMDALEAYIAAVPVGVEDDAA